MLPLLLCGRFVPWAKNLLINLRPLREERGLVIIASKNKLRYHFGLVENRPNTTAPTLRNLIQYTPSVPAIPQSPLLVWAMGVLVLFSQSMVSMLSMVSLCFLCFLCCLYAFYAFYAFSMLSMLSLCFLCFLYASYAFSLLSMSCLRCSDISPQRAGPVITPYTVHPHTSLP